MPNPIALLRSSPAVSLLPDDILMDVFMRLPPEPGHLLAASLVCRRWSRVARDRTFLGKFREFHRTPPMLGYFENAWTATRCSPSSDDDSARFIPIAAAAAAAAAARPRFSLPTPMRVVKDCRHGLVLLYSHADSVLVVWDPMSGDTRRVRAPCAPSEFTVSAALVCGADDHTGGRARPFKIVFVSAYDNADSALTGSCVFSSDTGAWSDMTMIHAAAPITSLAGALVGDAVNWLLNTVGDHDNRILEVGQSGQRMAVIQPPPDILENYEMVRVMRAVDGGVGFVGVHEDECSLHFWSRRFVDGRGVSWWALIRVADLRGFTLPDVLAEDLCMLAAVVGVSEFEDVLFMESQAGVFMIDITATKVTKVSHDLRGQSVFPYASFYKRGRDIVGIDDRALQ
ncbi:hypothetical protein ACP70R_020687 [Stipagrostis hirtigluma subsp. patula]